jgi:hydrogenase maturation protein HypF
MDRKESQGNITVNIKIWGIVQGVGFRPFVSKLASSMGMKGRVRNLGGLVEILLTDTEDRIELFIDALKQNKPTPAEIVHIEKIVIENLPFSGFEIESSMVSEEGAVMIPSDLAICDDCIKEIYDPKDRRYGHPFNSCMVCGPRYSIVEEIPYDRVNTSMKEFQMCPACAKEYSDIDNRRFHAQTISCHDCGPFVELNSSFDLGNLPKVNKSITRSNKQNNELSVNKAIDSINSEGILALKGTGGYYFACSAFSDSACSDLREIKKREEKPFAVMFRNLEQIRKFCICSDYEEELLKSNARPIVLLEKKPNDMKVGDESQLNSGNKDATGYISEKVSTSSRYIGAFLPSIALQYLILDKTGPLVMTSANISSQPIIIDDETIEKALTQINENRISKNKKEILMLSNQREILTRLDDSVVRVIDNKPQIIRRSKGYAPIPLFLNTDELAGVGKRNILAVGGQLKSAFALTKGNFAYVSEFLSDLESLENTDVYDERVGKLEKLLQIEPNVIVCDSHPLYYTTKFAKDLAEKQKLDLIMVQHHHAHIASVMAEHDIKGEILGFSFDGTGYGTDGNIWGSEMLICEGPDFRRLGHLEYVKMLGGDSSMKEAWKSCFSYLTTFEMEQYGPKKDPRFDIVKAALSNNINSIKSSSMGRLFDAVASLLEIKQENSYEGECAIILENFAAKALYDGIKPYNMSFAIGDDNIYSAKPIFQGIIKGMKKRVYKESLALGFHIAVAELIFELAKRVRNELGIEQVALSGGVFQNKILMEAALKLLRDEGFKVFYNISVPPNDGGICLGQAYIGNASKKL